MQRLDKNLLEKALPETFRALAARYDPAVHQPAGGAACATCQGTRYIRADWPVGHPRFGTLDACPVCNPVKVKGRHGLFTPDYALTWDSLIPFQGSNARAVADCLAGLLARGYGGMYLWSATFGNAKTELLKIAVAEWVRAGRDGRFILFGDLLEEIKQAFDAPAAPTADPYEAASAFERLQYFQRLPLLALDELEEAHMTNYANDIRFRLFNERYERATRLGEGITLITSNLPPTSLPPKLFSRFSDPDFMTFVEVKGKDARPSMNKFRTLDFPAASTGFQVLTHPATGEVLEVR